ncbi:septum formation initiator family protein [Sinomonas halotolerans]|uniref:FtsB family cell division protein n=1 Tax=Sinomonas halotolerans TaxID=1644133 RepID=UPI0031F539D0
MGSGAAGVSPGERESVPAAGGQGAAAPPAEDAPVPARAFSGRMLALAVVLVAITIMLAPTVRVFLNQRAEITALEADIAAKEAEQRALEQEISRWEDPNYVQQQARDRINMVMPGETSYWVFGDPGAPAQGSAAAPDVGTDQPWTATFWDALRRAATD